MTVGFGPVNVTTVVTRIKTKMVTTTYSFGVLGMMPPLVNEFFGKVRVSIYQVGASFTSL